MMPSTGQCHTNSSGTGESITHSSLFPHGGSSAPPPHSFPPPCRSSYVDPEPLLVGPPPVLGRGGQRQIPRDVPPAQFQSVQSILEKLGACDGGGFRLVVVAGMLFVQDIRELLPRVHPRPNDPQQSARHAARQCRHDLPLVLPGDGHDDGLPRGTQEAREGDSGDHPQEGHGKVGEFDPRDTADVVEGVEGDEGGEAEEEEDA
mmetsp:Transcript_55403/g.166091  ORF Transcript_55403/g.166091 Transcript_55403/m.166091 type:complete len:204 (-) Transcript_55403:1128-1739(-)